MREECAIIVGQFLSVISAHGVAMALAEIPRHQYTFRQYLDFEQDSNTRHEFFAGEIYAMAGGTPEHAALAAEIIATVRPQLGDGPCRVYTSDLRIRVSATGLTTYPDVTVICGTPARDPESPTTIVNPTVIFEVLSESTETYDRQQKRGHYEQIPSLAAYVLVSHREQLVEVWTRTPNDSWRRTEARTGGQVALAAIACSLDVTGLYTGALGEKVPR